VTPSSSNPFKILNCWYIFVRFVGHVTKLVPIRLGEPKEGQQHHNGAVDLPSNQLTTYLLNATCISRIPRAVLRVPGGPTLISLRI